MEILAGAVFLVALVAGILLILFFATVHPIWGIVDCAMSPAKSSAQKAAWIVVMILTWSLGSILYGLFGASGAFAKMTRIVALVASSLALVLGASLALFPIARKLLPGPVRTRISRGAPDSRAREPIRTQPATAIEIEAPATVEIETAAVEIEPFTAIHFVPSGRWSGSSAIMRFDARGPIAGFAIPVDPPVNQVAVDPKGPVYYALTMHQIGRIVASTGKFIPLDLDPRLKEPSWPSAIAFDSRNRKLIVAAQSQAYSYDPATGAWKLVPSMGRLGLVALSWDDRRDVLHGLVHEFATRSIQRVVELSPEGATLNSVPLSPPIPVVDDTPLGVQLAHASDHLIVLLSARMDRPGGGAERTLLAQMYRVDGAGRVVRLGAARR